MMLSLELVAKAICTPRPPPPPQVISQPTSMTPYLSPLIPPPHTPPPSHLPTSTLILPPSPSGARESTYSYDDDLLAEIVGEKKGFDSETSLI